MKNASNHILFGPAALLSLVVCVTGGGCSHLIETQAITAFTNALESEDLDKLHSSTTERFSVKALRTPESVTDFSVLHLPSGKIEVVEVDEVGPAERRVNAQVKGTRRQFRYRLVKNEETGKWQVDDIYLKQKKDGIVSTRPVTELMDLVTTVREFLTSWDHGVRSEMVNVVDPDLARLLEELPDAYLARMATRVIGDRASESNLRPEAQMDDDVAVVRLPRKSGQMIITFRRLGEDWRISDLAVESRTDQEHIASVKQFVTVLVTATRFLDAYNANDKKELQRVTAERFFNNSLVPANLSSVVLPTSSLAAPIHQIRLEPGFAEFLIPSDSELVKVSLNRIEGEDAATPAAYQVDDVTIYEIDGREQKRLSAMFLSHAMVEVFSESLSMREINAVRQMSTTDFRSRVWQDVTQAEFQRMSMPEIESVRPVIESTMFNGLLTEVQVKQGSRVLVYVLRDQNGELLVDDIRLPVVGRPNSMKQTLAAQLPVQRFAEALATEDLEALQLRSSRELNRLVWHSAERVPSIGLDPLSHLSAPLTALESDADRAVVGFGNDQFGARVVLVREGDHYVVEDILLIAGPEPQQRMAVRDAYRAEMARFRTPVSMSN